MAGPDQTLAVPKSLPEEKRQIVGEILDALESVPGLVAAALGGSCARGTQRRDSDIDIGLYYFEADPCNVEQIRDVAERFAAGRRAIVSDLYEWGPWVNGGAWIPTRVGKVDFLYRNIDQLRRVIRDAREGRVQLDFLQQPPYGFPSVIYLGEIRCSVPLHDPCKVLAALKEEVVPYPPALRQAIIREILWGAEFTLLFARDFSGRGDVYNTVGCLTRGLSYLTQVLFAINETYFISDKEAIEAVEAFVLRPEMYAARVKRILARPGATASGLSESVQSFGEIFSDVVRLAGDHYQPKYSL